MEVSNDNNDSTSTTATCWLQRIELDEERDNGLVTLGHVDAADAADARCVVVCRPSLWSKQATESLLRDPETPIRLKQRNDKCVPSISNQRGRGFRMTNIRVATLDIISSRLKSEVP